MVRNWVHLCCLWFGTEVPLSFLVDGAHWIRWNVPYHNHQTRGWLHSQDHMIRTSRFNTTFPRSLHVLKWLSFRDWIISIPAIRYAAGCEDTRLTCGRTGSSSHCSSSLLARSALFVFRMFRHETSMEVQQLLVRNDIPHVNISVLGYFEKSPKQYLSINKSFLSLSADRHFFMAENVTTGIFGIESQKPLGFLH